jgi:hypothetical protein
MCSLLAPLFHVCFTSNEKFKKACGRLPEMAHAVDWSPDGQHLAVGFLGGFFGVFDAATMERIAWHRRSQGAMRPFRFSHSTK